MTGSVFTRRRVIVSALWSTIQQGSVLASTAVMGIVLARVLSLGQFGVFAYVTALASMGMVIVTAGLSALAIRFLVEDVNAQGTTLANLVVVRELAALVAFGVLAIIAWTTGVQSERLTVLLGLLVLFARAADVAEPWFQAEARTTESAPIRLGAVIVMLGIRVAAAAMGAPLIAHVILYVAEGVVVTGAVVLRFLAARDRPRLTVPSGRGVRILMGSSWILLLAGIAAQINSRSDIIMLQAFRGSEDVGLYAAAARLSELAYFLPVVFMTATFPRLLQVKKQHGAQSVEYRRELQRGYDTALWFGVLVAGAVFVVGGVAITLLFGPEFEPSVVVLRIHVLALPAIFMAAVLSKWLVAEGLYGASLFRNALGAVVNVALNLLLVPRMGIEGAAWATVASYVTAAYLACWIHPSTRSAARQMSLAVVAPVRCAHSLFSGLRGAR